MAKGGNALMASQASPWLLWCEAVSKQSAQPWEYWFLLDSDAEECSVWADIVAKAERPR